MGVGVAGIGLILTVAFSDDTVMLGVGIALNKAGRLDDSNARYDEARAWHSAHPEVDHTLREQLDYLYAVNLMSQDRNADARLLLAALVEGYRRQIGRAHV